MYMVTASTIMTLETHSDPAQRFSLVQSHQIHPYHSRFEQPIILPPVAR